MEESKVNVRLGRLADRAFMSAYERARDGEKKERIAKTRKLLKAVFLAPDIVGARLSPSGKPIVMHHWITLKCNASCEQCLWKNNSAPQMYAEEIKRAYKSAAEAGIMSVVVGGGEPTLRKDLGEVFRFAKERCGWKVGTATNGTFLETRIDEYGDCLDTLIVSLDSADPAKHDRIRGVPGLFDKAVRGIEKVRREYPFIHLFVNCCLDDNSVDEVEEILALAADLGVPISFDVISTVQHVAGEGTVDRKGDMIESYERMAEALRKIRRARDRGSVVFNSNHYLTSFDRGKRPYECRYPYIYVRMMPNGDIEDCTRVGDPMGNIQEESLSDILASEKMARFRESARKCWSCSSPAMVDASYFYDHPAGLVKEFSKGNMLTKTKEKA